MKKIALLSILITLFSTHVNAQSVLDVDSVSGALNGTAPFNRPFKIKLKLDQSDIGISYVMYVKKYRNKDFLGSLERDSIPTILPSQYYETKKLGSSTFLIISIADKFLLEPSTGYYFIVAYKKLDNNIFNFFDNFSKYLNEPNRQERKKYFEVACSNLDDFNKEVKSTLADHISLNGLLSNEVRNNKEDIEKSFDKLLLSKFFTDLDSLINEHNLFLTNTRLAIPDLSDMLSLLVNKDTTIKEQAYNYVGGKDYSTVSLVSDLMTLKKTNKTRQLISGEIILDCIYCKSLNTDNKNIDNLSKRSSNIDKTINSFNQLRRDMLLLNAKLKMEDKSNYLYTLVDTLIESKKQINAMLKTRKKIDATLLDSVFIIHRKRNNQETDTATQFSKAALIMGNSYLDFETRNKMLIAPDFGVVTSSLFIEGKNLDYGIVPYLGFHINFMEIDKGVTFSSYKPNIKQYLSIMVGWSLVNMKNYDSTYTNFFEKSSLLTGIGVRLNNNVRITAGAQWLFKTKDHDNNPIRLLQPVPYLGISFDLDIKEYLNGFIDVLSGIGKTKPSSINNSTNQ